MDDRTDSPCVLQDCSPLTLLTNHSSRARVPLATYCLRAAIWLSFFFHFFVSLSISRARESVFCRLQICSSGHQTLLLRIFSVHVRISLSLPNIKSNLHIITHGHLKRTADVLRCSYGLVHSLSQSALLCFVSLFFFSYTLPLLFF